MSAAAAAAKNADDVDRQVVMLAAAYRRAGAAMTVELHAEDSTTRGRRHYRLLVDGFPVTTWDRARTVEVWLSLLDMRRAVEAFPAAPARQP